MRFLRFLFVVSSMLVALPAMSAHSVPVRTEHARAELVVERTAAARTGDTLWAALRLQPDAGWHVYWSNPGDAGMPPSLAWTLPAGWSAGPLLFPVPARHLIPPLASFGYERDVWYPVKITVGSFEGSQATLRAKTEWLICREECVPEAADLSVTVEALQSGDVADAAVSRDSTRAQEWNDALARLPLAAPAWNWKASYGSDKGDSALVIAWDHPDATAFDDVFFFPAEQGLILHAAPQTLELKNGRARLFIPRDDVVRARPDTVRGVIVLEAGRTRTGYTLTLVATNGNVESQVESKAEGFGGTLITILVGLGALAAFILVVVLRRPHGGGR